jgi:uncharacterized damage-inducible protein DinB
MMKKYFIELAAYNSWANDNAISWLEKITVEQWEQPVDSSFENIATTVIHVANAESIWLQRLKGVALEKQVWLTKEFKGTKEEALKVWKQASLDLEKFFTDFDETKMQDDFSFRRLNGEFYTVTYYQVLAHIFNHSTFHRGQLVTMLRQTGFTELSSTDITQYFRK